MKLFLMSQNIVKGYDTYNSVVVAAHSEDDARTIHPSVSATHVNKGVWMGTFSNGEHYEYDNDTWPEYSDIHLISVEYLGETERERGVVCASFKAG